MPRFTRSTIEKFFLYHFHIELELTVIFEVFFNAADGAHDGGMVAFEGASDGGQGERCMGTGEIHRDFTRITDFLFTAGAHQFIARNAEIGADAADDGLDIEEDLRFLIEGIDEALGE